MANKRNQQSQFNFASVFTSSGSGAVEHSSSNSPVDALSQRRGNDDADQPQLTTGLRYEANRPRTPPKQVSHLGPGAGDGNNHHGRGVRAARNRGALADLFPEAGAGAVAASTPTTTATTNSPSTFTSPGRSAIARHQAALSDDYTRGTSHELTFSREGRDGVVDQMLSTFDQLGHSDSRANNTSTIIPIPYYDPDQFPINRPGSRDFRPRGHTYSSSTSSSFAPNQSFDSPNRSARHHRNKSSANSNNFQTTLGRVDSTRVSKHVEHRPSTQGAATIRARRNSKGLVTPGKAEGTNTSNFRNKQQVRRSASFDQAYIRKILAGDSIVLRDPVTMAEYDDLNAAPEPSVRPGPRRFGDASSVTSVGSQVIRGRDGARPFTGLRRQGQSPHRSAVGQEYTATFDDAQGSGSASFREPAHAPVISNQRQATVGPSYRVTAYSTNAKDATVKEKGGFFKRMFGGGGGGGGSGSRNGATTTTATDFDDQVAPNSASASIRQVSGQEEQRQQSVGSRAQQTHLYQREGTPEALPPPPPTPKSKAEQKDAPTLSKKPSFFRRRKKSVAAAPPPVPVIPNSSEWTSSQHRDHSPASSLRKVMTPYLGSRPGTRAGRPSTSADTRPSQFHEPVFENTPNQFHVPSVSALAASSVTTSHVPNERLAGSLALPRAIETTQRQSSSRTRRDRPANQRGDSYSRSNRNSARDNTDAASETSDNDFISAKSQINSPVDDSLPDMFQPPPPPAPPASAPPAIPTVHTSDDDAMERRTLDPGKTPTVATHGHILVAPSDQDPGDEAGVPHPTDDDYDIGHRLYRFDAGDPPLGEGLPTTEDEICPWLGENGSDRARIRKAYLEQFDFREISILSAMRRFCEHCRLKGETQQVDRILEGIARRWTECNPSHSFKSVDIVHTICYSLLLLNTDLHIADIEHRMTRNQFIRNAVPTIMRLMDEVAPDAFDIAKLKRMSIVPPSSAPPDTGRAGLLDAPRSPSSPTAPKGESGTVRLTIRRNSNEFQRNKYRLSARPSDNYALENLLGNPQLKAEVEAQTQAQAQAQLTQANTSEDCGPLVKQPFLGGRTAWESQLESVLKNFYNSIQKQRLPLQGSDGVDPQERPRAQSSAGQRAGGTPVRRTPSIASKQSDGRGRNLESRGTVGATSSRWTSRHRNRPRLYAASSISVDDDLSVAGMSPSASSLWSKHSFGRTQTSMSMQSFGSDAPGKEAYQQSIGFANALSQAIIREEGAAGGDESDSEAIKAAPLLEDETLELYGAPWAKEGTVKHKHHLESMDKKAKDRAWTECFAVIEKGWLRLFRFNSSSKSASLRSKTLKAAVAGVGSSSQSMRAGATAGGKIVVGGGNWMDNALPLGRFLLRQTIASALPPPGYSKSRPHVWALSLPNGAVHLFQAGTPEIVREYVTCANYWSARLSKEPLTGGVSNMEYGWSESLLGDLVSQTAPPGSRDGSNTPQPQAQPSSVAESFNAKRQRSASASSSATQLPATTRPSRGFTLSKDNRPPSSMHSARPSMTTSIRSSFETTASAVVRPRLPGDHVKIADWTPPSQSMVASALLEIDQLRVLSDYVATIKRELERHNELRSAILLAYSPRHPNHARAISNFEKKSAYLLREIVKFSTYVETLQAAQQKKEDVYRERDQRKKELEDERAREASQKVETAEQLRRELSKSDLRVATKTAYGGSNIDDDDEIPDVPEVPQGIMKMIT